MTVIELKFPAGGRFHATPWGRHVNEGATEWPPSPWRIQRALVATWYLKAREIEESVVKATMDLMAAALPSFELPPAVQSHTRHYMPGRKNEKPKVFDTFVQSSRPVRIAWDVTLDEQQRQALAILCERLGYLGRAESIVEASLQPEGTTIQANSLPIPPEGDIAERQELVRLLCANDPAEHASWLQANQPEEPAKPGSKPKKTKGKPAAELPQSIFDALHAETGVLQAQGWLIPPGSRWADYSRETEAFEPEPVSSRRWTKTVTVARFAIASSVLPRITDAVSVAERVHQVLAKRADKKACAPVFTGKAADGTPLSGHQHTHIFCELGEKRDTIGFITLYAPGGFNAEAQQVIEEVQRKAVWGHGGHDLDLILLGLGDVRDFDIPIFGKSKRWVSLTPFVPTRHAKHYADGRPKLDEEGWPIGSPEQDLRRLVKQDRDVVPSCIKTQPTIKVRPNHELRPLQYQTQRFHGGGKKGHQSGVGMILEFDEEQQGPLAFGYGSHFGLGLFVPAEG